jgi:hypothetical protein
MAGLFERLLAAAAIVDAQTFKNSRGAGFLQSQLPHRFFRSYAHCVLLAGQGPCLMAPLDVWMLLEQRGRADDFCHGHHNMQTTGGVDLLR